MGVLYLYICLKRRFFSSKKVRCHLKSFVNCVTEFTWKENTGWKTQHETLKAEASFQLLVSKITRWQKLGFQITHGFPFKHGPSITLSILFNGKVSLKKECIFNQTAINTWTTKLPELPSNVFLVETLSTFLKKQNIEILLPREVATFQN